MSKPDPAVAGRHIFSALHRLKNGGRLVAITGRNFAPISPMWRDAFVRLQGMARVSFSVPISGSISPNVIRAYGNRPAHSYGGGRSEEPDRSGRGGQSHVFTSKPIVAVC